LRSGSKRSTQARTSQRDLAYGVIRRAILLGQTKRGTRVNERILAEKLGISRVPVREALLCLHGEGLISKSRRGLEVTRLSLEDAEFQIEFRSIVECAAVRLAAERITPDEIERLRELLSQQAILELAKDVEAFCESDQTFHQLILRATKNPFISRLSGSLAMGSVFVGKNSDNTESVTEGHRQILEALAKRDADLAEQLMYHHIAGWHRPAADETPSGKKK
jgi:DNA-binding GntR family transcriptional regulator